MLKQLLIGIIIISFLLINANAGGLGKSPCGGEYYGDADGKYSAFKYSNSGYNEVKIDFTSIKIPEQSLQNIYSKLDTLSYQQGTILLGKINQLGKKSLQDRNKNVKSILDNKGGVEYINNISNSEKDLALSMEDSEYTIKACDAIQGFNSYSDFEIFRLLGHLNIIIGDYFDKRIEENKDIIITQGAEINYSYVILDKLEKVLHTGSGVSNLSGIQHRFETLRYNSAWHEYNDNYLTFEFDFLDKHSLRLELTDFVGVNYNDIAGKSFSGSTIINDYEQQKLAQNVCFNKYSREVIDSEINDELFGEAYKVSGNIVLSEDKNYPEYKKCENEAKLMYQEEAFYEIKILPNK